VCGRTSFYLKYCGNFCEFFSIFLPAALTNKFFLIRPTKFLKFSLPAVKKEKIEFVKKNYACIRDKHCLTIESDDFELQTAEDDHHI